MWFSAITLALLPLLELSFAQPGLHHGGHRHRANRAFLPKRGRITVSDDPSVTVPTEFPQVVVYVDQYGNPIRTTTETVVHIPKKTSDPQTSGLSAPVPLDTTKPISSPVVLPAPPPPAAEPGLNPSNIKKPSSAAPVTTAISLTYPIASSAPDTPTAGDALHGVTYSPYKGNGNCKTADEVDEDFGLFSKDYGVVRIYGVDCNQVATVSKAAKKYGNKLFLGIFDIKDVDAAVATMAADLNNDWSVVETVSVGNELVNNGGATVGECIAALDKARKGLRAAGYQGPVVIVDTFIAVINNPELCDASDYCAVNVHPFFDPNTGAPDAGSFVNTMIQKIRGKLYDPSKRVVVTETGWPWQGEPNGAAVPGLDHQSTAISSIKGVFGSNASDVYLFTAFNDLWKKAERGTFMAEQFWGMGGRYSPCDK